MSMTLLQILLARGCVFNHPIPFEMENEVLNYTSVSKVLLDAETSHSLSSSNYNDNSIITCVWRWV